MITNDGWRESIGELSQGERLAALGRALEQLSEIDQVLIEDAVQDLLAGVQGRRAVPAGFGQAGALELVAAIGRALPALPR